MVISEALSASSTGLVTRSSMSFTSSRYSSLVTLAAKSSPSSKPSTCHSTGTPWHMVDHKSAYWLGASYPDWLQFTLTGCNTYPDWVQDLLWLTLTGRIKKKIHVSSLQLFFTTILCWWSLMSYSNLSSMLYMSFVSNSSSMLYMSFVSNLSWMLYMSFLSRFFSKLYTSFLSNSSSMLDTSFLTNSSSTLYTSFLSNSSSMLYTLFLTNSSPMLYTSFLTQLRFSALHLISP